MQRTQQLTSVPRKSMDADISLNPTISDRNAIQPPINGFDETIAIENISKKAAVLKQMLQQTEEKMKAALIKSDQNRIRSKSTEPTCIPKIGVDTQTTVKLRNLERQRMAIMAQVLKRVQVRMAFNQVKAFKLFSNHDKSIRKVPSSNDFTSQNKSTSNERYSNGLKSSLDDCKTFESLEKELKAVIVDQKHSNCRK